MPYETSKELAGIVALVTGAAGGVGRATPVEIAEVIAFLVGDRSSIITGAVILADGGYTAQ